MRDFVFENKTKIYFGKEQLCHLHEEVARFGKRVLMVYGGGSIKRTGLYDKVMDELQKADMEVFELSGVEPNPHHTTVNKGAAICKKEGIDVLLALETFFFETLGLKSRLSDLGIDDKNFALMAKKACGPDGVLHGFTDLTPADVEKIYRMCL